MNDLSDWDLHDAHACGGIAKPCGYCDEEAAARIKAATKTLCRICGMTAGTATLCARCEDKMEQIRMERLYDSIV